MISADKMHLEAMPELTLHPERFVMYAFPWGKKGTFLENFDGPLDWQMDVLKDIGEQIREGAIGITEAIKIAVASGHGIGKSALVAMVIIWGITTCTDSRGVVTANTENQLKTKTWAELSKWHNISLFKDWFTLTATSIYSNEPGHERTWRFDMVPWSKEKTEAFAGLHNKGKRIVVIMDEASAIIDPIWEVTEGALTDEDTEIIWLAFGNPTRNQGRFHSCFNTHRHRWHHRQIDSRSVAITNKKQIDEWVADYGEDSDFVRVRVKGEFPHASDHQFISTEIVNEARGRHLDRMAYDFAPVVIGVDRAWTGDETLVYLRQGLMAKKLGRFNKNEDDMVVAGHVAQWEDQYQADAVFIDLGYGTGVKSAGNQLGRKWKLIPFGSKSDTEMYADKGSEMWGLMKEWLVQGGSIPNEPDLITDLTSMMMTTVMFGPHTGKMRRVSKEVMKRDGIDSQDDGDALALTFAFPVMNKSQKQFKTLSDTKESDFDPFKVGRKTQKESKYNPLSPLAKVSNTSRPQSWHELHTRR